MESDSNSHVTFDTDLGFRLVLTHHQSVNYELCRYRQRSIELKAQNPKNATPGRSAHNYAFAVDMNVKDTTGKVYRKKDRNPWVESGIPQLAKKCGLRWGGDFKNYVDCIHFDAAKVTDTVIANAAKDNKGLPQSQWNTKNTNYV